MKKITFLAYHKDYKRFLTELRDLGLIHVAETDKTAEESDQLAEYLAGYGKLSGSYRLLEKMIDKKSETPFNEPDIDTGKTIPLKIEQIQNEKSVLNQQLQVSIKERDALLPWGNFEPEEIQRLKEEGYYLHFFIVPDNQYNPEWEEQYDVVIINKERSRTYFVTVTRNSDVVDELDLEEVKFPEISLARVNKLIASLHEKIDIQDKKLEELSADLPSVRSAMKEFEQKINFTKVLQSTTSVAEDKLMLLQGWVPEDNLREVASYLDSKEAYYEVSDPTPEDVVPIQFKNNRFFRLFEPIAEMYMLPKYNEIDLTPYLAPFYMVFFGLALGDIGYGVFFLVVATLIKMLKKSTLGRTTTAILSLVQVLGVSTMVCGLLTGGFFGFDIYNIEHPFVQALKNKVLFNNSQMFTLSLILGVVQVLFGMCLKVANRIKQFGFVHALSTIGWVILLSSIIFAYLFPKIMPMFAGVHLAVVIPAMVLIFFFNSPGKNLFMNFGLGLWNTYNMITGLLGDILSYIRLFALGLSGGILASVFNSLAVGMSPKNAIAGPIVTITIFLIGHAITIFMGTLSALIHPARLTFVEFFKNAEFEGGGKKYIPFGK